MIFAAGLGTRLKPFTDHHPKALALVNGKTLLQHNIEYLQRFGIVDVVVNVHHFADQIEDCLIRNDHFGSRVSISDERKEVLETGGGLLNAASFFRNESFVVMNVDILTSLDLHRLIDEHHRRKPVATLAIMKRDSSRQLFWDKEKRLCGWVNERTGEQKWSRKNTMDMEPFAFSGIQILHTDFFRFNPFQGKFSIIDSYLHIAREHVIAGLDHSGDLLLDVGKPESIALAEKSFYKS